MKLKEAIRLLTNLGNALAAMCDDWDQNPQRRTENPLYKVFEKARLANGWFTESECIRAMRGIVYFLEEDSVENWLKAYEKQMEGGGKVCRVGLIMAGNIPAVGFHDMLCVLISGHTLMARCSSDDLVLPTFLASVIEQLDPSIASRIHFSERLQDTDAVIATGSNNSARYFDYYFGKNPALIRRNRNSVGVLSGKESSDELYALGSDIFSFYGLGCRNVSKLYVPSGYIFNDFFTAIEPYGAALMQHNKYMNNYDYNSAIYLLNQDEFLTNNFLILKQSHAFATPVSVLHYEYYEDSERVEADLQINAASIQCRVGKGGLAFGNSQLPGPGEYADGVDTMQFLLDLKN